MRGDPDLNQAKFYYECIVCDDYEVLNWFKQECERILVFFPKCTPLKQYLSIVETLIHFNEQELFDYLYLQQYEIEKPSYRFDYSLKLIPDSPGTYDCIYWTEMQLLQEASPMQEVRFHVPLRAFLLLN